MNIIVKHVIEITGGLLVGGLLSDAVNKGVEVSKKAVKKRKQAKGAH